MGKGGSGSGRKKFLGGSPGREAHIVAAQGAKGMKPQGLVALKNNDKL